MASPDTTQPSPQSSLLAPGYPNVLAPDDPYLHPFNLSLSRNNDDSYPSLHWA